MHPNYQQAKQGIESQANRLMRTFGYAALTSLFAWLAIGASAVQSADKLNVLFILSDDMRPELGCYGAPVQTPNIDKLAAVSTRFDRAYCQYPLCNPSRTSLLTGLHPTQTGVLDNSADFRKRMPDRVTLPQMFKNAGYTTVRLGKVFHGGIDDAASWSEGAEPAPRKKAANKNGQANNKTQAPSNKSGAALANDDGKPMTEPTGVVTDQMRNSDQRIRLSGNGESHGDYRTADAAIAAMERLRDQPFFITCGFTKPHAAPAAPSRFYDLYPAETQALPADFAAYPTPPKGFPPAALTKQNIDLFWNREARAEEARLMLQSYRASVSWVDWNVGRVLEQLDKLGLREKTIVVFWGDHGYHLGEMGKWSKHGSLFETGTRVPMMISVPGSKGNGSVVASPVQTLDIFPTLASLCGLTPPADLQGHDLKVLLEDPLTKWTHPAFSVAGSAANLHRSVRVDQWRYIEWSGKEGGAALIDETNDPREQINLINDPAHAETREKLKNMLREIP